MSYQNTDADTLAKLNRECTPVWLMVPSFTTAGNTRYLGIGAENATELNVVFRVPFACTLTRLVARSTAAPGGGQSFTLTVRKNQADTTMTGTISGTDQDVIVTTNQQALAQNDLLAFKVVGSAGSAASGFQLMAALQQ